MAESTTADSKSFIARVGNSFLALIGAATHAEFPEKFSAAWQSLFSRIEALEKADAPTAYDDSALKAEIKGLSDKLAALGSREDITNAAKSAAEQAANNKATEILGAVGLNPQVPAAPAKSGSPGATKVESLIAEGKYAEAWAADPKLQEQFIKAEHYEHYMKAAVAGRVFAKS